MYSEFEEMAEKLTAVVCIILVMLMLGCATPPLPYCERFGYHAGTHPQLGHIVAFDMDNAEKLANTLKGLSEGKCRLAKDGDT